MPEVTVEGFEIHYERDGSGPPVVLLHGLPGSAEAWSLQVDDFARTRTVIRWDAPGCGRSSEVTKGFTVTDVARCLAGFVRALELERPHMVGLSWGTGVLLALIRDEPTLAKSVVLASGYAGWAGSLPPEMVAARLELYLTTAADPSPEAFRRWLPGLLSDDTTELGDLVVQGAVAATQKEGLEVHARAFATTDLRAGLGSIVAPTLVLHGDRDTRSPVVVGRELHESIPGSELVILGGVGHLCQVEDPTRLNAAVLAFLDRVDSMG